jgi:hypothetical protein
MQVRRLSIQKEISGLSVLLPIDHVDSLPDAKTLKQRQWSIRHYYKNREQINAKRNTKRALAALYYCSCGAVFQGKGSWQVARTHYHQGHAVYQYGRQKTW